MQLDSAAPTAPAAAAGPVAVVVAVALDCLQSHLSFVEESCVNCLCSIPDFTLEIRCEREREDLSPPTSHLGTLTRTRHSPFHLQCHQGLTNWANVVISAKIYQIFHTVHHF